MKGLEPSEKCVVEKYMRNVKDSKMTDEQKTIITEKRKYAKQKKLDLLKEETEYKERMINLAISKRDEEEEKIAKSSSEINSISLRKIYDKEEKKCIHVEYRYDQPQNKVVETFEDIVDPDTEEVVSVPVTAKTPYYEDEEGERIKKYWNGPPEMAEDGSVVFTKVSRKRKMNPFTCTTPTLIAHPPLYAGRIL